MDKVATFKDFIKIREYITLKYDYYARLGRFKDLSPEEKIEHDACWKLIKELKGFMDNVEENFEDFNNKISPEFWTKLKDKELIHPNAPI